MNIILEMVRYFIIIIIGIVSIKWFERKKGWKNSFIKSLLFIFCWKTIMLFLLISTNLLLDILLLEVYEFYIIYLIMTILISFSFNIILGVRLFKAAYNQKIQESIVIILIIVIIEMILESVLLYSTLIPASLLS